MAKRRSITIDISPLAQLDLKEIERFIAKGSVKYSKIEKRLIIGAIEKLLDFPELGTPFIYKDISARPFVFKNYRIIYRLKTALIEIITIHHHARSLGKNPAFNEED